MFLLRYFYFKILKYDLMNKFIYKDTREIPILEKIILNFGCKTAEIKQVVESLMAFELMTTQKGLFTIIKYPRISLKIQKGNFVGCKVTLRKINMFSFFFKSLIEIFPKFKNIMKFRVIKNFGCFYELYDVFVFSDLEMNYYLFSSLSKLEIVLVTSSKTLEEFLFILNSLESSFKNIANIIQLVEYDLAKIKVEGSNPFICI